jgi:RNA recognition motif-containing protein
MWISSVACFLTNTSFVLQVKSVFLVVEPRSRVSRGFAFITMDNVEDANRCIKHLNQSIVEGRYITVERVSCLQINGEE